MSRRGSEIPWNLLKRGLSKHPLRGRSRSDAGRTRKDECAPVVFSFKGISCSRTGAVLFVYTSKIKLHVTMVRITSFKSNIVLIIGRKFGCKGVPVSVVKARFS